MRVSNRAHLHVSLGLLLAACLPTAGQGTAEPPTVLYRLQGDSGFLSGCIEGPCTCPIQLSLLAGTFGLTAGEASGAALSYAVTDIQWFTHWNGTVFDAITGSGVYSLDEEQHRLLLDLQVNGGEPFTVDSGLVPRGAEFPTIDIAALSSGFCFQEGVTLDAAPSADWVEVVMPGPWTVAWTVVPGVTAFDAVWGDLRTLRGTSGDFTTATGGCLGNDVDGTALDHVAPLAPGSAVWLLVRGVDGPGYDGGSSAGRDDAIDASPAACP